MRHENADLSGVLRALVATAPRLVSVMAYLGARAVRDAAPAPHVPVGETGLIAAG